LSVKRNFFISGFCFSMAVLIEYSAALCLFPLGYLLLKKAMEEKNGTMNSILKWGMAGIPCLALFFFYHKVAFGGYLTLPQAYQNPVFVDQGTTAFMGVLGIPSLNVCYLLLLGAKRGLLLISPVLIFTFLQIPRSFSKQNPHREEYVAAFFCFVAFFYFNAAFNGWHGGGSSGPRYLIPGLPFLALFLLQAKNSKLFRGLLFISAFNICLIVSSYTLLAFEKGQLWKNMFQILVQENRYFWPFIPVAIAMLLLYCLARKIDQYE